MDRHKIVIHTNKLVNIIELRGFNATYFTTWIVTLERRTVARVGYQFVSVAVMKFQALNVGQKTESSVVGYQWCMGLI